MFGTKQRTETQFREINATTVHISETKANHANSMALLQQNGLRPMTYQEAIVLIDRNRELKAQLKGKWFYLEGKGLKKSGYHTFDNAGRLVESVEGKGDIEKTAYAYSGNNPLALYVRTDEYARRGRRRFTLNAFDSPQYAALVVVGVRAGHEAATPKIEALNGSKVDPELVSEFKSVVAKMDSATQAGVLNAEITEVAKKVLRAIE